MVNLFLYAALVVLSDFKRYKLSNRRDYLEKVEEQREYLRKEGFKFFNAKLKVVDHNFQRLCCCQPKENVLRVRITKWH